MLPANCHFCHLFLSFECTSVLVYKSSSKLVNLKSSKLLTTVTFVTFFKQ
jgi:hypothetical protein